VWAGACAGELLGLRGALECSDLDYLRSALDGKRGALERQLTKRVRTHTHKLKPLNHFTVVPHFLSQLRFNRSASGAARGRRNERLCYSDLNRFEQRKIGTTQISGEQRSARASGRTPA